MLRRFAALLTFLALAAMPASGTAASNGPRRVALVIGNSTYVNVAKLANPANDATDIAAVLNKVGFEVILRTNLGRAGMAEALRTFGEAARGAEAGLFYYAGHGMQVDGENFLVPTDAVVNSDLALDLELIPLKALQRAMEPPNTKIIILDACRDNPLARSLAQALGTRSAGISYGLAAVQAGKGTLISFSTAPGTVALDGDGRNSPYAQALVKHIGDRRKDLNAILIAVRNEVQEMTSNKQMPWDHSSLTAPFYFVQPDADASLDDAERELWASVKNSTNPEDWKRYLEKYPNGFYAVLAQAKIVSAEQEKRYGEIKQAAEHLEQNLQQIRELRNANVEPLFWSSVKDSTNPEVLKTYLERYPDGVFAPTAKALIRQYEQQLAASEAAGEEEKRRREEAAKLRELQRIEDERKAREAELAEARKRAGDTKNTEELHRLQSEQHLTAERHKEELERAQTEAHLAKEAAGKAEEKRLAAEKALEEARKQAEARKAQELAQEKAHREEETRKQAEARKAQELAQEMARREEESRKRAEAKKAQELADEKARREAEAANAKAPAEERARKDEEAKRIEERAAERARNAEEARKQADARRAKAKQAEDEAEEQVRKAEARRPGRRAAQPSYERPAAGGISGSVGTGF